MAKDQGRSTRHIDVSGIKAPDAKITTVWYNKSKRQEVLGKFLAGSDETPKEIFLRYLFIICLLQKDCFCGLTKVQYRVSFTETKAQSGRLSLTVYSRSSFSQKIIS